MRDQDLLVASMTYPGGKNGAGVWQQILNQMPPHSVFIEPFLGSGALMRRKRPALLNIGIDRDRRALGAAARAIGGESAGVLTENGVPVRHAENAERPPAPKLSRAATRRRTPEISSGDLSTLKLTRQVSGWIHSSVPALLASLRCRSAESGEAISEFHFSGGDGIRFLEQYRFRGEELVYCDPPYVRSVRSEKRDQYRFEMTDVDHRRLLRVLRTVPCHVMLSGYWSALYAAELAGWRHVTFTGVTRGGPATEWLWCNFPEPIELHDTRYVGENWRERDRINKKKRRWIARLAKMPRLERQALLAAIADLDGSGEQRSPIADSGEGTRLSFQGGVRK
jgi:hypothetical protein